MDPRLPPGGPGLARRCLFWCQARKRTELARNLRLVPGIVTLAQVTGAPVLTAFLYREADYRHQVWEISAPVPVEGDPATALRRCAAEVSAAIRRSPALWFFGPARAL